MYGVTLKNTSEKHLCAKDCSQALLNSQSLVELCRPFKCCWQLTVVLWCTEFYNGVIKSGINWVQHQMAMKGGDREIWEPFYLRNPRQVLNVASWAEIFHFWVCFFFFFQHGPMHVTNELFLFNSNLKISFLKVATLQKVELLPFLTLYLVIFWSSGHAQGSHPAHGNSLGAAPCRSVLVCPVQFQWSHFL